MHSKADLRKGQCLWLSKKA